MGLPICKSPIIRDYPFAASEAAIRPKLCPISKPSGYSDENATRWMADPTQFRLSECHGGVCRLRSAPLASLGPGSSCFSPCRAPHPRRSSGGTPNREMRSMTATNNSLSAHPSLGPIIRMLCPSSRVTMRRCSSSCLVRNRSRSSRLPQRPRPLLLWSGNFLLRILTGITTSVRLSQRERRGPR